MSGPKVGDNDDNRLRKSKHRRPRVRRATRALKAAGAERIYAEKVSGAVTDRKALAKAIAALGFGDVLLVTRLDRLARSTRDLLNVLDSVSKAGAKFRSLADSWADTSTMHGELMITILAGLEHVPSQLNQGDSLGAKDERVYRH